MSTQGPRRALEGRKFLRTTLNNAYDLLNELPDGYVRLETLDLMQDRERLQQMVRWGLVSLFSLFILFWWAAARLRPDAALVLTFQGAGVLEAAGVVLLWVVSLGAATFIMIILHEAVHGFFFWLFSGHFPEFGFKGYYAYAAMPDGVYLQRDRYILAGIAPVILLTMAGLALLPILPAWSLPALLIFLAGNASGSVGDVLVVGWLRSKPSDVLIEDNGAVMVLYGRS
jgi:hypothetical protein